MSTPIELVIDDPQSEHARMVGALQPPQGRHGQLREIEFGFAQLKRTRWGTHPPDASPKRRSWH